MKLRILGCSGGIGQGLATTAMLLDDDILIDCGTGVGRLTQAEMTPIRHLFISHSHLDHCALLPMLLDNNFGLLEKPFKIYGLASTLNSLKQHLFNDQLWPDFTRLPTPERPVAQLCPIEPGEVIDLNGRRIRAIAVEHTVDAVGYLLEGGDRCLAFSGDTATNDSLWAALNEVANLDVLIVETAFVNQDRARARAARHYCPETLAADLQKLNSRPEIYISHLKPGAEEVIMAELTAALPGWQLQPLEQDRVFELSDTGPER